MTITFTYPLFNPKLWADRKTLEAYVSEVCGENGLVQLRKWEEAEVARVLYGTPTDKPPVGILSVPAPQWVATWRGDRFIVSRA